MKLEEVYKRARGLDGRFIQKSDEPRKVRSIRLTDRTWKILGTIAEQKLITRADLIEFIAIAMEQPRI